MVSPNQTENNILATLRRDVESGAVPVGIYGDEEIYQLELERVFGRTWVYLAHESEIPEYGDFVARNIGNNSVLICRNRAGDVKLLMNQCRHRGATVCQAEAGNLRRFHCIYHGWTYDTNGSLVGVPMEKEVYGNLNKEDLGLRSAQVGIYEGLIFGCTDPSAPPLCEYLGDGRWYLDFFIKKSAAGLESLGPPQRWVVDADWKIPSENAIGDAYHTPSSHRGPIAMGLLPYSTADVKPGGRKAGVHVSVGNVDLGVVYQPPEGSYMGYPSEMIDSLETRLNPDQVALLHNGTGTGSGVAFSRFHLFPNLSIFNVGAFMKEGVLDPYLTFRVWHPIGPGRMEVFSWLMVERDQTDEFKARSRRAYLSSMGPSGMLEQDDMENWRTISRAASTTDGRKMAQYLEMGLQSGVEPITDWIGPGTAYPTEYTEHALRSFTKRWMSYLLDEGAT